MKKSLQERPGKIRGEERENVDIISILCNRIFAGFFVRRSCMAVSSGAADRKVDFTFGETIAKGSEKQKEILGGVLWLCVSVLSFTIPFVCLAAAQKIHPMVRFLLESFWCYQIFAARSLTKESKKVYRCLKEQDLKAARKAVSMIVGRDTENLTEEGVIKAAVETVAENTSDGVTAPLFYMMLGGAPLGFLYKAVNTMDSMLGYKNEKYLYFGKIPAKLDDIFNYIPARLTALTMICASFLAGMDGKNAKKIYLRDRNKHASPNGRSDRISLCRGASNPACRRCRLFWEAL